MAQRREVQDRYFKQAKADGYAARSAYKLIEINNKRPILRRGDRVVDLGCSPGSWVQVASDKVGDRGLVVGIDLKPVTIPLPSNARTVVADVFSVTADDLLNLAADRPAPDSRQPNSRALFDVVLSDMAPSTEGGGGGTTDHFRSVDLCRRVLELLPRLLKPGGRCVMKVFEGEAYPELLRDTGRVFVEVKGFKPDSSRDVSREMFIIATGYRPLPVDGGDERPAERHAVAAPPPRPREGWGG